MRAVAPRLLRRIPAVYQSTLAATVVPAPASTSSLPTPTTHSDAPLRRYDSLVSSGSLRPDTHQRRIIDLLQTFHANVLSYAPPPVPSVAPEPSLLSRIFARTAAEPDAPPQTAPKGLYLYGDVGTGKTMLMDLFYHSLPSTIARRRRVHFHAFMIDVHKRVHAAKAAHEGGDPIAPVARDLASEAYVLCFDEFQVTDIADAMILRRLFENLLKYGVVMIITSK